MGRAVMISRGVSWRMRLDNLPGADLGPFGTLLLLTTTNHPRSRCRYLAGKLSLKS